MSDYLIVAGLVVYGLFWIYKYVNSGGKSPFQK